MLSGKDPQAGTNSIDRILESAVYLNWKDFTSDSPPNAVRLEYRAAPTRSLKCLKLWSCVSRGHWRLVCEYWMEPDPTHQQGITFTKTYSSPGFTRMLDAIMQHQEVFSMARGDLRGWVVQIGSPDEAQCAAARRDMTEALERITSRSSAGTVSIPMRFAADHPAVPPAVSNRAID